MNDMKTPPHNIEAERAVLGSILLDTTGREERVMDVCQSAGVVPETFFDPRNRAIYGKMVAMTRASKPLDALTLTDELLRENQLEAVGGAAYIQSLIDQTPTTAHAEYYIGIIVGKQLRRTLIDRATSTIAKCYDEGEYPDARVVLGDAEKAFLEIDVRGDATMPWASAIDASYRHIDAMFDSNGRSLDGLATGLSHLDEKLQGLKNSEMIVIAARPSVGKTSLAMNIAESCALGMDMNNIPVKSDGGKRHPVMIFSLEMPIEALTRRMIAGRAHVNMWRLNRSLVPRHEREEMTDRLCRAADELKRAPIYVDDTAALDIMDLRARARRMKKRFNIELIVIDYLQLCCCREAARQSRQIEVSMISQQIKAMAKELKVPVVVLSQLSRDNEKRDAKFEKPKLSDLRDSGAIEQDADVVFLLRRPSKNSNDPQSTDENLAIIDIAKNRNGETGEVEVNFLRKFTRFVDRPPKSSSENATTSEPPPEPGDEYTADPLL